MRIQWNKDKCYACRMCQLTCAFHHTGRFWPDKSSIDLYRQPTQGAILWRIDDSCDLCRLEPKPLCVKYCKYGALRLQGES